MVRGQCKHQRFGKHGRCSCSRTQSQWQRKVDAMSKEYGRVEEPVSHATDDLTEFEILAGAKDNGTDDFELAKMVAVIG